MKSSYLKIFLVLYLIQFCFAIHIPANGISYTCKEKRICENCLCNPIGSVVADDQVAEVGETDTDYACMRAVAVLANVTEGSTGYYSWHEDDEICSWCSSDANVADDTEKTDVYQVTCSEDSDEIFMDGVGVTSIIVLVVSILTCICLTAINKMRAKQKAEVQMDFQKVVNASRTKLQIDDASDNEDAAETSMPRPASIPTKTSSEDVHKEHAHIFKAESNDNWTDESKANLAEEMQEAMQQMQNETKANDNNPMDG